MSALAPPPSPKPAALPGSFIPDIPPALRKQRARHRNRHIVTHNNSHVRQAQTPQQRAANARFAKQQETKMGRPAQTIVKRQVQKSPISKGWVVVLAFILCGGLIFELLRLFF